MLKLAVLVSGGGTNLQAIIRCDQQQERLQMPSIAVVISNNANAYALERARSTWHRSSCASHRKILKTERLLIRHSLIN